MAGSDEAPDIAGAQRQTKVLQENTRRLMRISALHFTAYSVMNGPVERTAPEFFFAMGDLLEGRDPKDLDLKVIDKQAFLRELQED